MILRRATNRIPVIKKDRSIKLSESRAKQVVRHGTMYDHLMNNPKASVCVIRSLGGIGDVLMVLPSLRQLKKDFPAARLTFAIDMHRTANNVYYALVKNVPFIDEIIDARYVDKVKYSYVFDVTTVCIRYESSKLPTLNRIDIFARSLGIPVVEEKVPYYQVTVQEAQWASTQLPKGTNIAIHTASFDRQRCWPKEKYLELVQLIKQHTDWNVILFDFNQVVPELRNNIKVYDFSNTNVREMAALIAGCDMFVGPDSGPMHLAGALGVRSLILFGSIPPKARINYYPTHTVITAKDLKCLGCWYQACKIGYKCMNDISAKMVLEQMQRRLYE